MRLDIPVTSDRFDRRLTQVLCFGGAPVILVCAATALGRMGASPTELLTGVLAAAALSVGMVLLGIVNGPTSPHVPGNVRE
jgi:hypothetical protein